MPGWLPDAIKNFEWSWANSLTGLGLALLAFIATNIAVMVVVVKMPATYFVEPPHPVFAANHVVIRWTLLIIKNILGVLVIISGIFLSLPGIPGPGLLLILVGITLLNFPGKRKLEQKLLSRPVIYNTINKLRHRYGKPPIILDAAPSADKDNP